MGSLKHINDTLTTFVLNKISHGIKDLLIDYNITYPSFRYHIRANISVSSPILTPFYPFPGRPQLRVRSVPIPTGSTRQ